MNLTELETKTKDELVDVAKDLDISGANGLRKQDLVFRIMQAKAEREGNYFAGGILEMAQDGYGFLRTQGMKQSLSDVYVSQTQIRRFALRVGDYVMGAVRQPKDSEKYYGLLRVDAVNGLDPEAAKRRPYFEQLTPIFPDEMIHLEDGMNNLSTRVIDLVAPGRQRPARPHRVAAKGGQDASAEDYRRRHRKGLRRHLHHGCSDR